MRLPKHVQNALLFTLYLCRAGRANLASASEGLGISINFLEQIARKLRIAGVVKAIKGPGGGYELVGEPTVGDVFRAVSAKGFLSPSEAQMYDNGEAEHRAFMRFVRGMGGLIRTFNSRTVRSLMNDMIASEFQPMQRLDSNSPVN